MSGTFPADAAPCRCGHPADMHEHYRPGSDCGSCGNIECEVYRAADAVPLSARMTRAEEVAFFTPQRAEERDPDGDHGLF